jgi:hypothetical protein
MGRKNVLIHELVASKSLSTSFISPVTTIIYTDNVSYQINVATTDSFGTLNVQVSDDYATNPTTGAVMNPGTWDSLVLSGTPTVSGATDSIIISMNQLPFTAIRLIYTSSVAGTGTADIYITTKAIGG